MTQRDEEDRPEDDDDDDDDDALDDRLRVTPERRAKAPRDRDMMILTRGVFFLISGKECARARSVCSICVVAKRYFFVLRETGRRYARPRD